MRRLGTGREPAARRQCVQGAAQPAGVGLLPARVRLGVRGGLLPRGQVANAVQLDQIFNTFDPSTRAAFRTWQQELAKAVSGNDQNLNNVLGNLPTFAADATDILQVLDIQRIAMGQFPGVR